MRHLVVSMAAALVLLVAGRGEAQTVSLSGEWRLNSTLSDMSGGAGADDGRVRPTGGRAPMGGGFGGIGGGSPMGGLGGGRPVGDPAQMKQRRELLRELLEPVHRMTIDQDDESVSFIYADGRRVTYRTNGKAEKHQALNGTVETETRWQRGALIRKTNLDDGTTLTETFTLEASGQLAVVMKTSGGMLRRMKPLRRVYDPAETSQPQEQ